MLGSAARISQLWSRAHLVHSNICLHMKVPQIQVPPLDVNVDLLPCLQSSMLLMIHLLRSIPDVK